MRWASNQWSPNAKEANSLQDMAAQLQVTCTDPDLSISSDPSIVNHMTHDDHRILQLSQKVADIAQTLIREISSVSVQGPPNKRTALGKTLKSLLRKGPIDDIQKRLKTYQRLLATEMMVNLR